MIKEKVKEIQKVESVDSKEYTYICESGAKVIYSEGPDYACWDYFKGFIQAECWVDEDEYEVGDTIYSY